MLCSVGVDQHQKLLATALALWAVVWDHPGKDKRLRLSHVGWLLLGVRCVLCMLMLLMSSLTSPNSHKRSEDCKSTVSVLP